MLVQVLVDNKRSWVIPYASELVSTLAKRGIEARLIHEHQEITKGNVLFLLSCEQKLKDLSLNEYNIVVHESLLPKGKGWAPLTWQVLEGVNDIPICLLEAADKIDSGDIYIKDVIKLEGHEINTELREKQGHKTIEMALDFVNRYPDIKGTAQEGVETIYARRRPADSQLNVNESIAGQFNLLRVVDNDRYPAYFIMEGHKYVLKIYKEDE